MFRERGAGWSMIVLLIKAGRWVYGLELFLGMYWKVLVDGQGNFILLYWGFTLMLFGMVQEIFRMIQNVQESF